MDIRDSLMFNAEEYLNLFTITKEGREQPRYTMGNQNGSPWTWLFMNSKDSTSTSSQAIDHYLLFPLQMGHEVQCNGDGFWLAKAKVWFFHVSLAERLSD